MIRLYLIIAIIFTVLSMLAWNITQSSNSRISLNIKDLICGGASNC